MKTKKKIILLSCMIALLVVTAVFNFIMTSGTIENSDTDVIASANYFENYRLERLENRNEELLQLDSVISSSETNSVEYSEALAKKTNIALLSEKEMLCETLIKAYGFEDAVVVIGLDSENVNVIAKTENLTSDDAILIYTIISEENIASPENVKIIPIY